MIQPIESAAGRSVVDVGMWNVEAALILFLIVVCKMGGWAQFSLSDC